MPHRSLGTIRFHDPSSRGLHPRWLAALTVLWLASAPSLTTCAQSIFTPWGNLHGMRIQGELVEFEAGLRVIQPEWSGFSAAVKYLQRPSYTRSANERTVTSRIAGLSFREVLTDTAPGAATLTVDLTVEEELKMSGVYFCLDLPGHEFADATVQVFESLEGLPLTLPLSTPWDPQARPATGRRIRIAGRLHALDLTLAIPVEIRVRRDLSNRATALNDPQVEQLFEPPARGEPRDLQLYLKLMDAAAAKGDRASMSISFKVTAAPDPDPVRLRLNSAIPGRPFAGIGGNFRLQFPKTDPAVIRYCLDNLPVTWSRVDLPWAEWHPEEAVDPLALAHAGQIHRRVSDAMETARTLTRRGLPVIVSVWSIPRWARAEHQPAELRGTALNPEKSEQIVDSLTRALICLKERYGVEAALFSFNEPETGVEVRQTPTEHAEFVLQMGRRMAASDLSTRMLLGDTAHGTPAALRFIAPGLADPRLRGYIGAVAFHTWRGCTEADLRQWNQAARSLGVPLLVTESGPDAHLHNYPSARLEPWFQLQEIDLYVRICALAQPATIMPWQLTTDYSVLTGGGVYSEDGPLRPTQRFWNLKQLGLTPPGAFALPISSDRRDVTSAAFADLANNSYGIHLVNNGGQRRALLSGLPVSLPELRCFLTDATHGMQELTPVSATAGTAEFTLPPASYLTLLGHHP
jgi:hypothetical protein